MLTTDSVREQILGETDRIRHAIAAILRGEAPNRFRWLESELWVDRSRLMVLEVALPEKLGCIDSDRVPDGFEEQLEYRGCRYCSQSAWDMVTYFATIVLGRGPDLRCGPTCASFLNYTVTQPLVNPALEPLFWLDLHAELDNRRAAERNLRYQLGPMAYDLSRFPHSMSEAPAVREAQVAFVKGYFEPELTEDVWRAATDEEWAAYCRRVWSIDRAHNLFAMVQNKVESEL
jgi:hypothetical protein